MSPPERSLARSRGQKSSQPAARRLERSGAGGWRPLLVGSVQREGVHHAEHDDYKGVIITAPNDELLLIDNSHTSLPG